MTDFFILLITSFTAVLLSAMSGGGSSIIAIPVMLWMGIPFPLISATQNTVATIWVIPAGYNYLKGRKVDWRFVALFSVLGLGGAYLGFTTVVSIKLEVLKPLVGGIILALVAYSFLHKSFGVVQQAVHSKLRRVAGYVLAPLMGWYEIFFGAGNGVFFTAVTAYTRGFDFIMAMGCYYVVAFVWLAFGTALFIAKGLFSWELFLPCVIGSVTGAYVGSRYAKYKGNKFVKMLFVTIGGILGLKLLLGF